MPASFLFPDALPTDLQTAMAQWRVAHPTATLAEIEQAVDQHLSASRAALIAATATGGPGDDRPPCPACGQAMHRAGERTMQVTTAHEGEVALTGQTYRCPACGTGLSPPR